jgi:hypothetical protein
VENLGKKFYPPHTIDLAIVGTLRMLDRGKVVVHNNAVMYVHSGVVYIGNEPMPNIVKAIFVWFDRYSSANPYKSGWAQ